MDWGLFDRNAGENRFLREEIVYSSTVRKQPVRLTLRLRRVSWGFRFENHISETAPAGSRGRPEHRLINACRVN